MAETYRHELKIPKSDDVGVNLKTEKVSVDNLSVITVRSEGDMNKKNFGKSRKTFTLEDEWEDNGTEWADRDHEGGWEDRYRYETMMISNIISEPKLNINTILEIGSGPGKLSNMIQSHLNKDVEYHLIDKKNAKIRFEKRKYKGKFFVKDLFNGFDISGLNEKYDMIITNDFLEHVANPSDIVNKCWNLTHDNSILFVSVPNWRMAHNFIYRGLFDFDNFKHFMHLHGFWVAMVMDSSLKTTKIDRLDSEQTLPDQLLDSWNWYFVFKRRPDDE